MIPVLAAVCDFLPCHLCTCQTLLQSASNIQGILRSKVLQNLSKDFFRFFFTPCNVFVTISALCFSVFINTCNECCLSCLLISFCFVFVDRVLTGNLSGLPCWNCECYVVERICSNMSFALRSLYLENLHPPQLIQWLIAAAITEHTIYRITCNLTYCLSFISHFSRNITKLYRIKFFYG
ncbi:hypothetical protein CW304_13410 [Bacillus sp. UFRGS-B20]|nr:hypothetical protein CW304_13410 [Bacillus sp. UFRGS-B20]